MAQADGPTSSANPGDQGSLYMHDQTQLATEKSGQEPEVSPHFCAQPVLTTQSSSELDIILPPAFESPHVLSTLVDMQGHNPGFHGQYHAMAQSSGTFYDHESPSGSDDDVGYLVYPDSHKIETSVDDDLNASLTSQTLNADGTPKRPMNAFMIFARRRRPQVAAENQSMRTGDVSKILSREWNGMSLSDKQFYLDQAKQLKENFNHKYPDYVYRRRPNNTRKRRKADPAPSLSADHASSSDIMDDYAGDAEYNDAVDVADTDDPYTSGQESHYASLPSDPSGAATPSRASNYQPPDPYHSLGDTRVSYVSRPGRATPDTGIPSTTRGSEHGATYYHPYLSGQQHHHVQSSYFPEPGSTGEPWSGARVDQSRVHMQSWSQNSHDLGSDDMHRGYPQPVSSHSWTTHARTSEGMPPAGSSGTSTTGFNFPTTLNTPFYPPESGSQQGFSSPSVPPIMVSPQHFPAVPPTSGNPVSGRSYPSLQQPYAVPNSSSIPGTYQSQARTVPHSHTSSQPVPYPQAPSANPPPAAGSGEDPSQVQYWSRER